MSDHSDDRPAPDQDLFGEDGAAQGRFSEDEWRSLTTIGVVEDSTGS